MALTVVLPKMGMTMVEGTITEWFVNDGDSVAAGDRLFSFETEKVDYEVEADGEGAVHIVAPMDAVIEAGGVVAYLLADGEDLPADAAPVIVPQSPDASPSSAAPARAAGNGPAAPAAPVAAPPAPAPGAPVKASPAAKRLAADRGIDIALIAGTGPGGRVIKEDVEGAAAAPSAASAPAGPIKASPVAKRLAAEHKIDLVRVVGSGPGGRIIKEDVEVAIAAPPPAAAPALAPLSGELAYRGMRRAVGQRMFDSLQSMAQLTMSTDVDMTDAVKLRRDLVAAWEADGVRLGYTDMVTKAAALALRDHPRVNAVLDGDTIRVQPDIHVGFAVALDEGLIVPVTRHTDVQPLRELARDAAELARKAREGGLTPDDLTGGTFTVTSLGMFGIDVFTPIVNPPQAAILGVGRITDRPVFVADAGTEIERRSFLTLSLTIDHRVIDGAPGAQYLQSVCRYLEHPYLLLTPV